MSKLKSKWKIMALICVIVVAGILCGIFIPRGVEKPIEEFSFVSEKQVGYEFSKDYTSFVTADNSTLYVNEKTSAIAIASKDDKVIFNSHSLSAARDKLASVISVSVRDEDENIYLMNSTDNSSAFKAFTIEKGKKNTVTVSFDFLTKKNGLPIVTVPVKFAKDDGGIKAEIDTQKIVLKTGFSIEKISILPGLFSEREPAKGCFYTVPDGSGAQIDLSENTKKAYSENLPVYGSDITFSEYSSGATLPCFSMTKGGVMLTSVIDEGDALSSVSVKHNKGTGGHLYNTFTITPYGIINGRLTKGVSFSGIISQTFYLTQDSDNNYNTVSSIIRDVLHNKGYLSSAMSDKFVDYPFFITAIGSETGKKNSVYTTFENASEIVALLKSRGVRCTALRLVGAGVDGLNTKATKSHRISDVLGGDAGYKKLCNIAKEKNSSVWYDVNIALNVSENGLSRTNLYSDFRTYLSKAQAKAKVSHYNSVYNNMSSTYEFMSEFEDGNICLNDMSYLLYTDVFGKIDRQTALANLKDKVSSLSVGGGLMLSSPAVYLMNQADAVFALPQKAKMADYAGVTSVPLLQMVLHGTICYGSEYINLNLDSKDAILKAVEYGAAPSFVFTYDGCDVLDYGVYATQTAKFYSVVKKMLPLMDMTIISHKQIVSGVYKITYDYSKVVYVNYNPSVVEVDGILVSAKDFVII